MNFYSLFLEKLALPLGDLFTGSSVMKTLRHWRCLSHYTEEQLEALSKDKLQKLLDFSVKSIPFYQEQKAKHNKNPYLWIKSFPILKKKDIREHIAELTSIPTDQLIKSETSGSSGERGMVYKSKKDLSLGRALILYIWGWAEFYPGKKLLQTGMTPERGFVKRIKDILFRTHYYVAFGLSDDEVCCLLKRFQNKKKCHLIGYASSLYVLAEVALKYNLEDIRFDKAISLGDKMFPHYRRVIKEAFACEVVDTYGCSEGFVIAAQKDMEYYYILSPHVYVELLDDKGQDVPDGEIGHVVVTSLDAYAMPLIRYYTGDLAVRLPKEKYPPQRELNFPLLERVIGRDTDIVKTASGKYMIVHFFTGIFEFVSEIAQFRVIQKQLDGIEIEYIPSESFQISALQEVEQKIYGYLKEPFHIQWKQVNNIPPTKSGKPQIILSMIKDTSIL